MDKARPSIPWNSFGRQTPISNLGKSLLAVGNFSTEVAPNELKRIATSKDTDFEKSIMGIEGTAFRAGRGKLLTCWHVCEPLLVKEGFAHVLISLPESGKLFNCYIPIHMKMNFIDERHKKGNSEIDVGLLVCPAIEDAKFDACPAVTWGDSTDVGVGDSVLIGGYPLGRDLFLAMSTNRGVVQPSFYDGVISAIIPATTPTETRLFQISSLAIGGISGGVVCHATTGEVLGMVTSGLQYGDQALPMTYAIPSEVLQPYVDRINFKVNGEIWQ
jgi:hypothetical protein